MEDQFQIIESSTILQLIDMPESTEAVEAAFVEYAKGEAIMPSKIYLTLPQFNGDFRAMPAYVQGYSGVKWVNVHPDNKDRGIPSVMATIILNDPQTGVNVAVMDGTIITNYRTGAAGGLAAKYMARKDSKTIGLVGAGEQARTQLSAIGQFYDLKEVRVTDVDPEAVEQFRSKTPNLTIKETPVEKAASSDILVTTTPVRKPIIKSDWIKPGTHINAIGADAPGKRELDPALFQRENVTIVVDDFEQASHSGEINQLVSEGLLKEGDIWATLPDLAAGKKKGRTTEEEITIFDSTGLAIQDIAVAKIIYEKYTQE